MRTTLPCAALLLGALALAGCGPRNTVLPEDTATHLKDQIDFDVGQWLSLSRPELAKLVDEWSVTVANQQKHARDHGDTLELLPELHVPATVPVLQQAHFSEKEGLSRPPYRKEGHDAELALHLARHGDVDAALRLAPEDQALRARIEGLKLPRNYPVEWTRLVGLVQQAAQLKLAAGELDGASELVCVHKQVRAALDAKAAAGPLGAALLGTGRRTLALAVPAFRAPERKKTALADDVEKALAEWGDVPAPSPALAPGASAAEVARYLGGAPRGQIVATPSADALERALDVLGLPLCSEGAQGLVAFLDGGNLTELLLLYRQRVEVLYPNPADLAHHLIDLGVSGKDATDAPGLLRKPYVSDPLTFDIARVTRPGPLGAFVRVFGKPATAALGPDARHFGPVHLDRSFEANRVNVGPDKAGNSLLVTDRKALSQLALGLGTAPPEGAALLRQDGHDLVSSLTLAWPTDDYAEALPRLLVPLWAAYGAARIDGVEGANGAGLTLTWEGGQTRARLLLPFSSRSPELLVEDTRGKADLAARVEAAHKLDRDERGARLAAGTPRTRLRRSLGMVNGYNLGELELGTPRAEAEKHLPQTDRVRRRTIDGGVSVLFMNDPTPGSAYWARQLFLRFGADDRLAELRVRYQEGGEGKGLRLALEKDGHGKPEEVPADWAGLWTDLGKSKVSKWRWRDDVTVMTYQSDVGGSEVVLRDRPADHPDGVALPALRFVSRGLPGCEIGDSRADVRKAMRGPRSSGAEEEVYRLPPSNAYEYVMVWYEKGKAARVVAARRARPAADPRQAAGVLQQVWSADLDRLGFVRRRVGQDGPLFARFFWHDDVIRVQSWAQETNDGPRVFTEWRTWPVTQGPRTARR